MRGEGEIRKRQEIEPVCGGYTWFTWESTCHSFLCTCFPDLEFEGTPQAFGGSRECQYL